MAYTKGRGKGKRISPYNWRADLIKVPNPIDRARIKDLYGNSAKSGLPFMLENEQQQDFEMLKLFQSDRQQRVKEYRGLVLLKSELLKHTIFFQGDEAIFVEDNWGTCWRRFSETYPGYERAMFYYKQNNILWRNYKERLIPKD